MTNTKYSISPSGEKFPLPLPADYKAEFARLKKLAAAQRKQVIAGLSRDEHRRILDVVVDIEVRHGFFISLALFSEEEFARLTARERRIALDIQQEGVPL